MKISRRGFFKLAGKATVAVAAAGAAIKAGAAPAPEVITPTIELTAEPVEFEPVVMHHVVADIHTNDLMMTAFAMQGEVDYVSQSVLPSGSITEQRDPLPASTCRTFEIDAYVDTPDCIVARLQHGTKYTLFVDHENAPMNTRGKYTVIVDSVFTSSTPEMPMVTQVHFIEVH